MPVTCPGEISLLRDETMSRKAGEVPKTTACITQGYAGRHFVTLEVQEKRVYISIYIYIYVCVCV